MANKRLSMRKIREILRLYFDCGLSVNKIHESIGVARSTIDDHLRRAKAEGLSWPLPEGLEDEGLEQKLFPSASGCFGSANMPMPDFSYMRDELSKKGVTLSLLWQEYKQQHPDGYQYSQFTQFYRDWKKSLDVTMRMEHKAGEKVFSDFAGTKLKVTDRHTGEVLPAHLFVTALGASSYTYAEAFWSEDTQAWCMGQAQGFKYFGGTVKVIVPDNPKTAVTRACRYEPDMNPDFNHMAEHFGCVVIPARVRHPQDKAVVESGVGMVTRWIIAALRNRTFFSLQELNQAIRELLEHLNNRPFKKLSGSRKSKFEEIDKPALLPLPVAPYQYTKFKLARVNIDYHVEFEKHHYSVPYKLAKQQVELRVTYRTVEIFHKGKRIASHIRSLAKDKASTQPEHMPHSHREYLEWTPTRIINWASKTGPNAQQLVQTLMERKTYPELAYRSCLGILRLGKLHGTERLEAACERALAIGGLSYKSVEAILANGLDKRKSSGEEVPTSLQLTHENIRGADYYKEENHADTSNSR